MKGFGKFLVITAFGAVWVVALMAFAAANDVGDGNEPTGRKPDFGGLAAKPAGQGGAQPEIPDLVNLIARDDGDGKGGDDRGKGKSGDDDRKGKGGDDEEDGDGGDDNAAQTDAPWPSDARGDWVYDDGQWTYVPRDAPVSDEPETTEDTQDGEWGYDEQGNWVFHPARDDEDEVRRERAWGYDDEGDWGYHPVPDDAESQAESED